MIDFNAISGERHIMFNIPYGKVEDRGFVALHLQLRNPSISSHIQRLSHCNLNIYFIDNLWFHFSKDGLQRNFSLKSVIKDCSKKTKENRALTCNTFLILIFWWLHYFPMGIHQIQTCSKEKFFYLNNR